LAHVARKRGLALGPLTVRAVATYDGPAFSAIDLEVAFEGDPPAAIDVLVERASRVCYVSNTLTRSPRLAVTVSPA
jgi:putative redox protein